MSISTQSIIAANYYQGTVNQTNPSRQCVWIRPGQRIQVADISIDAGHLYFGGPTSGAGSEYNLDELFAVDPNLPISPDEPDFDGRYLSCWPHFSGLDPRSRRAYLKWHADGRVRGDINPVYAIMFLAGLEKRLILDGAVEDAPALLTEAIRLSVLFSDAVQFRSAFHRFADAASLVLSGETLSAASSLCTVDRGTPLGVKIAIGRSIRDGKPIDPDLLISWIATEGSEKVRRLLRTGIDAPRGSLCNSVARAHPNGLRIAPGIAPPLSYAYRSICSAYVATFVLDSVPDISLIPNAISAAETAVLGAVAVQPTDRSARHAPFTLVPIIAEPVDPINQPSHEVLPHGKSALVDWAREQLTDDGRISLRAALRRFRGLSPKALALSEIERLADVLALSAIGVMPDPRFELEPQITEDALLFALAEPVVDPLPASDAYRWAYLKTMICVGVSRSDRDIASEESCYVDLLLRGFAGLAPNDKARLAAVPRWALSRAVPLAPLLKAVAKLTERDQDEIARIVIGTVVTDHKTPNDEVTFAKSIFSAIGRSSDEFESALRLARRPIPAYASPEDIFRSSAGSWRENAMRGASAATAPASIEPSPKGLSSSHVFSATQIPPTHQVIRTQSASSTAAAASRTSLDELPDMSAGRNDQSKTPQSSGDREPWASSIASGDVAAACSIAKVDLEDIVAFDGLDQKHRKFLTQLRQQTLWTRSAFDELARNHRLMPDGAIEAINEWAFDMYSDRLMEVDDDAGVRFNPELAIELMKGAA